CHAGLVGCGGWLDGLREYPQELYAVGPTFVKRKPHSLRVMKRRAPRGEGALRDTGHQTGLDDSTGRDYQDTAAGGNGFQGAHPGFPLPLSHPGRGSALTDKVREGDEGLLPCPALVMADLFQHCG